MELELITQEYDPETGEYRDYDAREDSDSKWVDTDPDSMLD
jgi:hypothetical protein